MWGSNPQPPALQSGALPTELTRRWRSSRHSVRLIENFLRCCCYDVATEFSQMSADTCQKIQDNFMVGQMVQNSQSFNIFIHIQCCYCYSRIYLFTFKNRIYIQEIHLFTFTGVFLIHNHIKFCSLHSHRKERAGVSHSPIYPCRVQGDAKLTSTASNNLNNIITTLFFYFFCNICASKCVG